jgi:hypothetical protein
MCCVEEVGKIWREKRLRSVWKWASDCAGDVGSFCGVREGMIDGGYSDVGVDGPELSVVVEMARFRSASSVAGVLAVFAPIHSSRCRKK